MSYYEYVYMLRGDLSSAQVEDTNKKYYELVEKFNGKIAKTEYWGLRNLAYKVKKNKKAHYCLFNLEISFEGLKELQRNMSVNENVLRYLAIKVTELDNSPSLMMKKNYRDIDSHTSESTTEQTNS